MDEDKVIICRCEDLTLTELRELLNRGYTSFEEIKRMCRAGMGPCQGKTCRQLILNEIRNFTGINVDQQPMRDSTIRPPDRPLLFNEILAGEDSGNS